MLERRQGIERAPASFERSGLEPGVGQAADMDSLRDLPKSFGHQGAYRVISELGRGGFATVYKAHQEALDRHVAIKVLRAEVVQDEAGLERFKREARAAARLAGHPHIVGIYDYGEQDGQVYLVLEFIDGSTLQQALASPLPAGEVVRVMTAVASALDFAHARQLVHRDVKPANVLLSADGRVVLSDFGLAKLLDSATAHTAATIGTPEYMSPEQIIGAEIDARSDIYSLGVMVYRAFAGQAPFQGSVITLLHKHVHEAPPPMAAGKWPVPAGVEQIVQRAMEKNPADRYATAGALAADLARAVRSEAPGESAQTMLDIPPAHDQATVIQPSASVRTSQPVATSQPVSLSQPVRTSQAVPAPPSDQPTMVSASLRTPVPPPPPAVNAPAHARGDGQRRGSDRRLVWGLVAALGLAMLAIGALMVPGLFRGSVASPTMTPPVGAAATAPPKAAAPATVAPKAAAPATVAPSGAAAVAAPATAAPVGATHPATHSVAPTAAAPAVVAAPAVAGAATLQPPAAPGASPLSTSAVVPALSTARNLHTATLLENGKILVVGGRDGGTGLATAELYDRTTNTWTPAGSMATPRYRHAAARLPEGKVLIVGGQDSDTGFLATAELYDPATNSWGAAQPMAVARASMSATVLKDEKILVVGGYNGGKFHDTAEVYDPAEDSWRSVASMSAVRINYSSTLLTDGTVLVSGGFGSASQATAERYDPVNDRWTPAGSMSEGRVAHTATLLPSGKVLVVGGENSTGGGTYLATAELYDPATTSWSAAAPTSGPRSGHVALVLEDDRVLVAGGRNKDTSVATAELYDPTANAWTAAGTMAVARWLPVAAPLPDGRILIAGGRVGNSSLETAEEYDPASNAWKSRPPVLRMNLTSQNDSGITGIATLADLGDGKLRVEIHAKGSGAGPQPAHIHEGGCTNLNPAPKGPLTFVTNGVSITDLDGSIQDLTSAPHAIHMHKSPDEMSIYVACADTRNPG